MIRFLIEPYLDFNIGHSLEKVNLWRNNLVKLGEEVCVFSYRDCPGFVKILDEFIFIYRLKLLWREVFTYFFAFKMSKKKRASVLGLTTYSPLVIAIASIFNLPIENWSQIIMNSGLTIKNSKYFFKKKESFALKFLSKKGCMLLPNLDFTVNKVKKELGLKNVYFLNDPIYFKEKSLNNKFNMQNIVLVSGDEDWRRTPLLHIDRSDLKTKIHKLILHGKFLNKDTYKLKSVDKIDCIDNYFNSEDLFDFYFKAKFCFIVYSYKFLGGSSNFALSILAGTPVLASEFLYAKEVFEKYGKIGEMFEYENIRSFEQAWERLVNWSEDDWDEFYIAREEFIKDVRAETIVSRYLELF